MQTASEQSTAAPLSDAEIARGIAAGDRPLLTALMRRNNQTLFRTARSILKDDAEAEDAVQEAYLLAYRAIGGFRADAKLSTWLVRIVVNESLGRLRRRNRRAEVIWLADDLAPSEDTTEAEPMSQDPSGHPERQAIRTETRRLLEQRIDALPEAYRVVFVLRAVEEMSVDETALCLDIPAATVRTRYFRARGLLREAIAREFDRDIGEAFSFAGERCDRIVAGVLARLDQPSQRHD